MRSPFSGETRIAFAAELLELCKKYGLGLRGSTVFLMKPEDFAAR